VRGLLVAGVDEDVAEVYEFLRDSADQSNGHDAVWLVGVVVELSDRRYAVDTGQHCGSGDDASA
jgi:hypothetical protein